MYFKLSDGPGSVQGQSCHISAAVSVSEEDTAAVSVSVSVSKGQTAIHPHASVYWAGLNWPLLLKHKHKKYTNKSTNTKNIQIKAQTQDRLRFVLMPVNQ